MLRAIDQEPSHIASIGIVPADLDPGLELSSAIADRIDEMVELVASELRGQGFIIKPSEHCSELMPEGSRAGLAESRSELPGL